MHALREPLGTVAIRLSLLDDEAMSDEAREHLEAMLASVHRMMKAMSAIRALWSRGGERDAASHSDRPAAHNDPTRDQGPQARSGFVEAGRIAAGSSSSFPACVASARVNLVSPSKPYRETEPAQTGAT